MADNYTPLPVKTKTAGDVSANIQLGTVTRLEGGTLTNFASGTFNAGSVVLNSGTVTTGSLTNLATVGTISNLNAGSVVVTAGSVIVTAGTMVQASGTLTTGSLTNVATIGTILNLNGGTVTVSNPGGGATSPKTNFQTSVALAAGGSATLAFTAITAARTGQLHQVIVSSSVPIKASIESVTDNATGTVIAGVLFTSAAYPTERFDSPEDNFFIIASNGTAKFQAKITNMDNSLSADVYATGFWDEIVT
mgnify:CR=1 FL=1